MDIFNNRIYPLFKELKMSDRNIEEKFNLRRSTIYDWKIGKSKSYLNLINEISDFLNVSTDYLLGKSDTPKKKGIKIPVLGKVQAGIPLDAIEDIIDYEEIPEEWTKQGEFFALQINGDSMEPRFCTGDVVIVRKQSSVDNGQIAIVLIDNQEATCKKILKKSDGISLISINTKYPPMYYSNKDIETLPVKIIGRAIELRAKL